MINPKNSSWLLRPFIWIWNLIAYIVMLTGRLVAVLIGLTFIIVGIILTITLVGAIAGIPMLLFGILLVVRGLW